MISVIKQEEPNYAGKAPAVKQKRIAWQNEQILKLGNQLNVRVHHRALDFHKAGSKKAKEHGRQMRVGVIKKLRTKIESVLAGSSENINTILPDFLRQ